jgi:hypothetical protein
MNRVVIERLASKSEGAKSRRFGVALALLTLLYIGAVIAFIIVY